MDLTFSVFMDIYKRVKLLNHKATLYLIFEVLTNPFSKRLYRFTAIASTIYEDSFSPYPLQHLLLFLFLIIAKLMGVK